MTFGALATIAAKGALVGLFASWRLNRHLHPRLGPTLAFRFGLWLGSLLRLSAGQIRGRRRSGA